MRIMSHRGRHEDFSFPDNTYAAVSSIWNSGLSGVEIDVWVTRDNTIILSHDSKIKGTNGTKWDIENTELKYLSSLDLGNGIRPSLLSDILKTVPKTGRIFIEIKCGMEIILPLNVLLNKSQLSPEQIAFIGFIDTPRRIETMAKVAETFNCFDVYTLFGRTLMQIRKFLAMKNNMPYYIVNETLAVKGKGIDIPIQLANEDLFHVAQNHGLSCHVWNVLKPKQVQWLQSLPVETVTTDKPKKLSLSLHDKPSCCL